jgi:hypothetical protein
VGDRADRFVERRPEPMDEGAQLRPRACDRDLLAEDGAQHQLERIDGAGNADPRRPLHEGSQRRILAEDRVDLDGIGVEVEGCARRANDLVRVRPALIANGEPDEGFGRIRRE